MTDPRIAAAEIEVERRRAALIDTARELQVRLQPATLARGAWESAKVKGADLAEEAVDAVKRRPLALGGAAAGLLLFLAREPILDKAGELVDALTRPKAKPARKPAAKTATKTQPKKRKPAAKPARASRPSMEKVQ